MDTPVSTNVPTPLPSPGLNQGLENILDGFPALQEAAGDIQEDFTALFAYLQRSDPAVRGQLSTLFACFSDYIQDTKTRGSALQSQLNETTAERDRQRQQMNDASVQYNALEAQVGTLRAQLHAAQTPPRVPAPQQPTVSQPVPLLQVPGVPSVGPAPHLQHYLGSATMIPRPRGGEPPVFDETERDPSRRQNEYTNWRSLIRLKLALDSASFPSPLDRILYTCSRLGGAAFTRVRDRVEMVASNPLDIRQWPLGWTDYGAVLQGLDPCYIVVDTYSAAVRDFEDLLQGDMPYANFISEFVRLADVSRRSDDQRVEGLKAKVNTKLQDALVGVTGRPGHDDINGWIDLLRELSNNLADREFRQRRVPSSMERRENASSSPADHGDPMQLDKIGADTPAKGPLSTIEKQRRQREGLCRYCGVKGHFVLSCPTKPKANLQAVTTAPGTTTTLAKND